MTTVNSTQLPSSVVTAALSNKAKNTVEHEKISCLFRAVDKLYELNQSLLAYRSSVSLILESLDEGNLALGMSVLIDPILEEYSGIHLRLSELLQG